MTLRQASRIVNADLAYLPLLSIESVEPLDSAGSEKGVPLARVESDREDLLAEAVALSPRFELQVDGLPGTVVAGFYSDDRLSIYVGGGWMVQLDGQNRVRRGYRDGRLLRSDGNSFSELTRCRTEDASQLLARALDPTELDAVMRQIHERLSVIAVAIDDRSARILRSVPPEADVERLALRLRELLQRSCTLAPAVNPRRSRQ